MGCVDGEIELLYTGVVMKFLAILLFLGSVSLAQVRQDPEGFRRDEMVDLVAAKLTATPELPIAGDSVRISVTVTNESSNAAHGVDVLLLAGQTQVGAIKVDVGARRTVEVPFSWTPAQPGEWHLTALVDPDRHLVEEVLSDNGISFDLTVASSRAAAVKPELVRGSPKLSYDLRVEALSLHSAKYEDGRPRRVTLSFRVVNVGKAPITKTFRTKISPGLVRASALEDDVVTATGLAPGEALFVSRLLVAPPSEFQVRVDTDVDRITGDQDTSNNVAIAEFKNSSPNVDRWVSIGPRNIDHEGNIGAVGALFHLAIDPQSPSTIYVEGNDEGVWKTTDAGANWQPLTDSLPTLRSTALALDPSNPSTLYLVTPDHGVFKTIDGGGIWTALDSPSFQPNVPNLAVLKVHPTNPNLLFLTSNVGIYKYQADASPQKWSIPLNLGPASDVIFDPSNPNTVYATLAAPATGIYTSLDAGAHWNKSLGCPGASLPATGNVSLITLAFAGSSMYAAFRSPGRMEVYRTTGVTCQVGSQLEHSWESRTVLLDHDNVRDASDLWNRIDGDPATPNVLYLSGTVFRVSTDGGQTFNIQSGAQPHADHHGLVVDPTAPQNIYVVCDGGIYKSSNRGAANSWTFLGDGILNVQFYAFSLAETDPTLTIAGTQDNGTLSYSGSTLWTNINGGDGATTAIDPTDAKTQYSMNQGPDSMVKQVGSSGWKPIACGIPVATSCFNLFYQLDPTSPHTVLASCVSLLRSDSPACNRGPNWTINDTGDPNVWTPILAQPTVSGSVLRTAVDRQLKLYYAGTSTGQIWAGPAGTNWQLLFAGLGGVSDINIDFDDPSTVYVSFIASSSTGRIFRMKRLAGIPTPSSIKAVDITGNLPQGLKVQALAVDRMNPFTIYAGTLQGVYRGRSSDQGATWNWTPYMAGLPLADVRGMEVQATTGVLRIITFGRGAYEVNTGDPVGSLLSASGRITFLRTNDPGSGFGPPSDFLDAEVIIQLDSQPGKSFGFQLRADTEEYARQGMLSTLRSAFRTNRTVVIDYYRTGIHNGRIIRVAKTN
jgi:CARDB